MFHRPNFQGQKERLAQIPVWIAGNLFVGFLMLLFVALLISSFVFYQYVFSARNADITPKTLQLHFQEEVFSGVLATWEQRSTQFETAGKEPVRDIFSSPQQPQEIDPEPVEE